MLPCRDNLGKITGVYFVKQKRKQKYPNARAAGFTHEKVAKLFGYSNVNSFRHSSAHNRIMEGVEAIVEEINRKHESEIEHLIDY